MRRYGVQCFCEGCTNKYPTIAAMTQPTNIPMALPRTIYEMEFNMDKQTAIVNLKHVREYLKRYSQYFLSQQYGLAIQYLVVCVSVINECVPMSNMISIYSKLKK